MSDSQKDDAAQAWTAADVTVEQALLGAAIINPPDTIAIVEKIIAPDDFSEPLHGQLWTIMVELVKWGRRFDVKLLISLIGDDAGKKLGHTGLTIGQYIGRLAAEATTIINAADYANTIRDYADQRRMAMVGAMLRREVLYNPAEIAGEAITILDDIVATRVNTGTPSLDMREATVAAIDEIARAYQLGRSVTGITWGLKDLDAKTLGLHRGDLTILAGRPGMGKTALALTTLRKAAEAGYRCLMESLEMTAAPLTQRMISDYVFDDQADPIAYYRMRSGNITEDEFYRIAEGAKHIAKLPIRIEQRPGMTVAQIAATARQRKRRHGLDLLVVDHMQLVKPSDRYKGNRVNELGEVSSGLKALAKELDIAVLALCQLSRTVEGRDDKRPSLADLRGSGEIEQDADAVVMLFREAYYLGRAEPTPGTPEAQKWMERMELIANKLMALVEKQRNGPIGSIELFCNIGSNAVRDISNERFLPATTQLPMRL